MYLSHPVRRMRENPVEGEAVTLVVRAESPDRTETLEPAIGVVGGTVEAELPYGALRVAIPQERIGDLCTLEGIETIETADVVGLTGDAGEDIGE